MNRSALFSVLAALALLASGSVLAQQVKPEGSVNVPPRGGILIPDDAYDGTLASMACDTFTQPLPGAVEDVAVEIGMDHTWVGDLVFKVVSPAGTVATIMSRPGFAEPADDGTGCCGNSAGLVFTSPISFSSGGTTDAETMGAAGGVVCQDDGLCSYFPNPGAAADSGDLGTIFDGEDPAGDWQFCVGDAAAGDVGSIVSTNFTIAGTISTQAVPAMDRFGLIALVLLMVLVAGTVLVRRIG